MAELSKEKPLTASIDDRDFKDVIRREVREKDTVSVRDGVLEVVKKFDGKDVNEYYEERLSEDPPILYRRSIEQLSRQFNTDPTKGGVLLKKQDTNTFIFVPNDEAIDRRK